MLDDISAFAGSVSDEEAWAFLKIFGEAGLVDDHRGSLRNLLSVLENGCVDFHAAGVNHRDDVEGIPDQVGDDGRRLVGDDSQVVGCSLGHQCVEGADGKQRLSGAEAKPFGGGYAHTQACV